MTEAVEEMQPEVPYYPSGGSNNHAHYMVELTNPDEIITSLENSLKGLRKVGVEYKQMSNPLLNQRGINSVIAQVRSVVNQVSILSFLDEEDIRKLIMLFSRSMIEDLMLNSKLYDITCPADRTKILTMSQTISYSCLKRALRGNDKNFWSRIVMMFSSDVNGDGGNSASSLSKIGNMFKR